MLNEEEFLRRAELDRTTLEVWIREEWLVPVRSTEPRGFTDMDVARAKLIHDLQRNMGVNEAGLDVILHLIDQMHGLRKALAEAVATLRERTPH
jgi:chaperone modulatory protein CbpM